MITTGDDSTFLLNTMSFRVFQIVHNAPAHIKSIIFCFFPRQLSTNSTRNSAWLVGELRHPKVFLRKDHMKTTMGHWKSIWSVVSSLSQVAHSSPILFLQLNPRLASIMSCHPNNDFDLWRNIAFPHSRHLTISNTPWCHRSVQITSWVHYVKKHITDARSRSLQTRAITRL